MSEAVVEHDRSLPHAYADGEVTYCHPDCPANPTGGVPLDEMAEATVSAPCSLCGGPVPMRRSEYTEMVALGAPVVHRECAQEAPKEVATKRYVARVEVFEVADDGTEEKVAATTAKAQAPTLRAAFDGPLSQDLQKKWLAMGERSALADLPG